MHDSSIDTAPLGAAPAATARAPYTAARSWVFLGVLFLVSMWNYVDRQLMSVLIEPIKAEFGVSDAQMGLLTGFAFAFSYAALGVPIARFSDRGDRRLIIAGAVAVWSLFTACCGLASSFVLLLLMRVGVGVGEAGALPPAQSLIADYFPPEKRTKALAIFMASALVGNFLAFFAGANLAATFGWRTAFLGLGLPGLLIGALAFGVLREPRRQAVAAGPGVEFAAGVGAAAGVESGASVGSGAGVGVGATAAGAESFGATLHALASKRTYVLIILAMVLYFLATYGATAWFPAYLGRVMKMGLRQIGSTYGPLTAVAALVGTLGGGLLTERLARRERRWMGWLPAAFLLACWALLELGLWSDSLPLFFVATGLGAAALNGALPGMFAMLHLVCGSARRAMAVALLYFFANLLGLGLGPLITGALSDHFRPALGPAGLRLALMGSCLFLLPAGAALLLATKSLQRDQEV
jgi:MFS family permease